MDAHAAETSEALVPPSLRALLTNIIDYAGQFPPARLSLEKALRNYVAYHQEPEVWMLARFIHPAQKLDALSQRSEQFAHDRRSEAPAIRVSALGTGGDETASFLNALENDLAAIDAFNEHHRGHALADVMEVRLPQALLGASAREVEAFLEDAHRRIVAAGLAELALFYEVPIDDHTPHHVPPILAAMAQHNSQQPRPFRAEAGLKMRCGGLEPKDFPSAEHLALAIAACRDAGVRFKATAGLHHPVRHYDEAIGTPAHGFLNVFGAAALAWSQGLPAADLHAILLDDTPSHFQFTQDGFSWQNHAAPLDDLRGAREQLAISFGSCSFEEPIDDLRTLELL